MNADNPEKLEMLLKNAISRERAIPNCRDLAPLALTRIQSLTAQITEATEIIEGLLPDFTGGIDPIESESVQRARAFIRQAAAYPSPTEQEIPS